MNFKPTVWIPLQWDKLWLCTIFSVLFCICDAVAAAKGLCSHHNVFNMFPSTLLCLHANHVRNHYVLLLVCPLLPWITELPWSALLPWPPSRPPPPSLLLASVLHLRLHWALDRRVAISCPRTLNLSLPQAHRPGKTTPITLQFLKHAPVALVMVSDGSC